MIKRVGIIAKPGLQEIAAHLDEIANWLDRRNVEVVFEIETAALIHGTRGHLRVSRDELAQLVDLVLVLGGDGTLLGMADRIGMADRNVPILGVNFGHLGFLTEISVDELLPSLEATLEGRAAIDERLMLHARIRRREEVFVDRVAVNDVVLTRGVLSRMLELSVSVAGQFVARFHGDGLIAASPTGSTAYNLSAGGPIVHPMVDAIVLTPIAPHTLTNRPVVIPASLDVLIQPVIGATAERVYLTLDGQSGYQLQPGDQVLITRAARPLRLIRARENYFDVLRQKLRWAER